MKLRARIVFCLVAASLLCARPVAARAAENALCTPAHAQGIWDSVAARLSTLLGVKAPAPPAFDFSVHNGETPLWVGRYDDAAKTVRVQCSRDNPKAFDATLRHEATHHFLHSVYGHVQPCLDEGLAAYMEAGPLSEGSALAHVNPPRLREFDDMLRWNLVPSAQVLLSGKGVALKPSQFYAACWGFTFYLLHDDANAHMQARRRNALLSMLQNKGENAKTALHALEGSDAAAFALRWHQALWKLRDTAAKGAIGGAE